MTIIRKLIISGWGWRWLWKHQCPRTVQCRECLPTFQMHYCPLLLCDNKSECNNTLMVHNQIDLLLHNALSIRSIALKSFFVNLHFSNWQSKASVFMNLQYRRSHCSASRLLCWIARQWISLRCTSQPCPDHRTCIKFSALRIQPDCQLGFLKLPQWLLERLQAAAPAQI